MSRDKLPYCTCGRVGKNDADPPAPNDNPPALIPVDDADVEGIVDNMGFLHIEAGDVIVTADEVLSDDELSKLEPMPDAPNPLWTAYFVVVMGREVRLFRTWEEAAPNVVGFPNNVHKKYTVYGEALGAWITACRNGHVHGRMHPNSLVPMIITQEEIDRRIAVETERRQQEIAQARVRDDYRRRHADTRPASPNLPASSATSLTAVASHSGTGIGRCFRPRAESLAESAASTSSQNSTATCVSVSTVTITTADEYDDNSPSTPFASRASTPSPSNTAKGKGPLSIMGSTECAALLSINTGPSPPPPAAWVVIRGVEPGVYTSRAQYLTARGDHPRVWRIPCATEELAEAIFAQLAGFMEFLDPE